MAHCLVMCIFKDSCPSHAQNLLMRSKRELWVPLWEGLPTHPPPALTYPGPQIAIKLYKITQQVDYNQMSIWDQGCLSRTQSLCLSQLQCDWWFFKSEVNRTWIINKPIILHTKPQREGSARCLCFSDAIKMQSIPGNRCLQSPSSRDRPSRHTGTWTVGITNKETSHKLQIRGGQDQGWIKQAFPCPSEKRKKGRKDENKIDTGLAIVLAYK